MRAVTRQSIVRTSSPYWYSRTSTNSTPRPLKTLSYSPARRSRTRRRLPSSRRRTSASVSTGGLSPAASVLSRCGPTAPDAILGDQDRVQYAGDHVVRGHALGVCLVCENHSVAKHVGSNSLDVS